VIQSDEEEEEEEDSGLPMPEEEAPLPAIDRPVSTEIRSTEDAWTADTAVVSPSVENSSTSVPHGTFPIPEPTLPNRIPSVYEVTRYRLDAHEDTLRALGGCVSGIHKRVERLHTRVDGVFSDMECMVTDVEQRLREYATTLVASLRSELKMVYTKGVQETEDEIRRTHCVVTAAKTLRSSIVESIRGDKGTESPVLKHKPESPAKRRKTTMHGSASDTE